MVTFANEAFQKRPKFSRKKIGSEMEKIIQKFSGNYGTYL